MRRPPMLIAVAGSLVAAAIIAPGAQAGGSAQTAQTARTIDASSAAEERPRATPSPDALVTFIAGLPRDRVALDTAAVQRSTPGELLYRDHPSLVTAGMEYGATDRTITRLRKAAKPLGIAVEVDPGRLIARLTATVRDWEAVYAAKASATAATKAYPFTTVSFTDGTGYRGVPAALKGLVRELVPSYSEYVVAKDTPGASAAGIAELAGTLANPGSPQAWPRARGTLPAGTCEAPALTQRAVFAPGQIQQAYGSTALAAKGVRGKGARLTVISLGGGYVASDIEAAATCFGYAQPAIDVVLGTGVPEAFVNGSPETHLDLITASSALPRLERITLLQVPDSSVAFADAFSRMLHGDAAPDAVSVSYGICEASYREAVGRAAPLMEDLLRMAAIVGTTVVAAAGDSGTSMCGAEVAEETGQPTASYPASSPWVTAVGGTRLQLKADNSRSSEHVWNDTPYLGAGAPPAPSGAGGPSMMFDRPWWQAGVTPVGPRTLPDVAVLGAIKPGWPIYLGGTLYSVGGTSGGTPFIAAHLAAMSAKQRDRGYPSIGFANAWLYRAASESTNAFYDITRGNNGVQLVGCCTAYRGYDMASGLGAPALDVLYGTLPLPAG